MEGWKYVEIVSTILQIDLVIEQCVPMSIVQIVDVHFRQRQNACPAHVQRIIGKLL